MPQISRIGAPLGVRDIVGSTAFAPTDYVLAVGPDTVFPIGLAGGLLIQLPGPLILVPPSLTTTPNPNPLNQLPANGDFYKFADPRGVVDGETNAAVIWGGGYALWGGVGGSEDLSTMLNVAMPFESWEFTFDQGNQAWIVCLGGPFQTGT